MESKEKKKKSTFVIIGGGIAGVTCAEHLNLLCPDETVTLITAADLVKSVVNLNQYGRHIEEFDVEEKPIDSFSSGLSNLTVVKGKVKDFDPEGEVYFTLKTDFSVKIFFFELIYCTCLHNIASSAFEVHDLGENPGGKHKDLIF